MDKNINNIIRQDLARFRGLLKQHDNFYDINQLHALAKYPFCYLIRRLKILEAVYRYGY